MEYSLNHWKGSGNGGESTANKLLALIDTKIGLVLVTKHMNLIPLVIAAHLNIDHYNGIKATVFSR